MGVNEYLTRIQLNYYMKAVAFNFVHNVFFMVIILVGVSIMTYTASAGRNQLISSALEDSSWVENVIEYTGAPILRVGLLDGYKRVDFHLNGHYTFTDLKGKPLFTRLGSDLRWRSKVENSIPAEFVYRVLLKTFGSYEGALAVADSLTDKSYPAKVIEIGVVVRINGSVINDSRKFRLVLGDFQTEEECGGYLEEFFDEYSPRVVRNVVSPPQGKIEFYDAEYDYSGSVDKGFRLIPESSECSIILHKVKVGGGFHWEDSEDREYPGVIEIRIDLDGGLMAVNEVSIDQYLKGVVPAEMPTSYPLEALKAQAVAARSEVLSKLGAKHLNDPYDLCAKVHCQVYSGLKNCNSKSDTAVVETTGEVLTFNGRICDAVYSAVCGGHTENKEVVWNSSPEAYLIGSFDSNNGMLDTINLQNEEHLRSWIDSPPDVFCNVQANGAMQELAGAMKYFRWEETYTRRELEKIIKTKTGVDIGTFFGIETLKRGTSGRLYEIEILGSRTNLKIKNELNIRRSLSKTHLKSSSFYVTIVCDSDSVPRQITFHGAGWGHGVGMCQVGAAVMAYLGRDYRQILEHYYPGTMLRSVYRIIEQSESEKELRIKEEVLEE